MCRNCAKKVVTGFKILSELTKSFEERLPGPVKRPLNFSMTGLTPSKKSPKPTTAAASSQCKRGLLTSYAAPSKEYAVQDEIKNLMNLPVEMNEKVPPIVKVGHYAQFRKLK